MIARTLFAAAPVADLRLRLRLGRSRGRGRGRGLGLTRSLFMPLWPAMRPHQQQLLHLPCLLAYLPAFCQPHSSSSSSAALLLSAVAACLPKLLHSKLSISQAGWENHAIFT